MNRLTIHNGDYISNPMDCNKHDEYHKRDMWISEKFQGRFAMCYVNNK